jgi:aspartate carbamoyltransferase catalytic subunit
VGCASLTHTTDQPGPTSMGMKPAATPESSPVAWRRKHLLGIEELSREEILSVLDTAESFSEISTRSRKKVPALQGRVVFNLFFENSTRTRTSFSLAAKRLSADTQDFSASVSSLSKGETFIDTAKNIEAMGADVMIVRHPTPGAPHLLAKHVGCSVINAGDGAHEHPTQALLDVMTIRQIKKRVEGLTVCLVGDIGHSRVARSNIWALTKLGARVILCGPPTLVPKGMTRLGCEVAYHLDEVLPECDVVNVLRIQFERQQSGLFPSVAEYSRFYGMTQKRIELAKPGLLLLAPGPINRGVELTPEVADGPNSAILKQVTNGLAVRMAVLYLCSGKGPAGDS